MERTAIEDVEPEPVGGSADRRGLTCPLDAAHVAVNHYRLSPGDHASGLHAHLDQEEVFVVVEGRVPFETLAGAVGLDAGEAIRFAPGEYHSGPIGGRTPEASVLALGAPRDTEAVRVPLPCPDCGSVEVHATLAGDDESPVGVCRDCGAVAAE